MICERCGCVFCPDASGDWTPGHSRNIYCTKTCRDAASRGRRRARSGGQMPTANPGLPAVRDCEWCGTAFVPHGPEQAYCKPLHRKKARIARGREAGRTVTLWEQLEVACQRKKHYPARRQAEQSIPRLRSIGHDVDHAYQCTVCGYWALTSRTSPLPDLPLALMEAAPPVHGRDACD